MYHDVTSYSMNKAQHISKPPIFSGNYQTTCAVADQIETMFQLIRRTIPMTLHAYSGDSSVSSATFFRPIPISIPCRGHCGIRQGLKLVRTRKFHAQMRNVSMDFSTGLDDCSTWMIEMFERVQWRFRRRWPPFNLTLRFSACE